MTKIDFNNLPEEQFRNLLKNREPLTPPARPDEEEKILNTVTNTLLQKQHKKQRGLFFSRKWFIPAVTAAVLVLAVWLLWPAPTTDFLSNHVEEYLQETIGGVYNGTDEAPVGEHYIYMAEVVSASR